MRHQWHHGNSRYCTYFGLGNSKFLLTIHISGSNLRGCSPKGLTAKQYFIKLTIIIAAEHFKKEILKKMEREPSTNLENTRDRFMDYIGNPLNGALGAALVLEDTTLPEERRNRLTENLHQCWESIFERLKKFRRSDFQPEENITVESIDKLLEFEHRNPSDNATLEEFDSRYWTIVSDK
jgi:hypothetical protein